ncbi:MAG: HAMP domain-containing protein, partial [Acidobacteriaceae bacterium]
MRNRRTTLILLAVAVFVLLLLLVGLNAFNLRQLNPHTTAQIFLLTSLSVLVFLLFVTVLVLLLRNLIKLLAEQRSQVLGARLRTRMFIGALLLSFVPALFMFLFSFLLLNRSLDRWFSTPAMEVRADSTEIAMVLSHYSTLNARAEAESIAGSQELSSALQHGNRQGILDEMRSHQITLQGGFAILYQDSAPFASYEVPQATGPLQIHSLLAPDDVETVPASAPTEPAILKAAQRSDEPMLVAGTTEYALGAASLPAGGVIVVGLPMPAGLNSIMADLSSGTSQYWALYHQRRIIRTTYFLLLLMLTALVFFASSWLALYVSRQMTGPLEALADAMDVIGRGDYRHRVTVQATAEMGELVRSFNHMAADLEQSRLLAESSARDLSAANLAIESRRNELETLLETIPSGVVTLD